MVCTSQPKVSKPASVAPVLLPPDWVVCWKVIANRSLARCTNLWEGAEEGESWLHQTCYTAEHLRHGARR
jgi:hypothetical protein